MPNDTTPSGLPSGLAQITGESIGTSALIALAVLFTIAMFKAIGWLPNIPAKVRAPLAVISTLVIGTAVCVVLGMTFKAALISSLFVSPTAPGVYEFTRSIAEWIRGTDTNKPTQILAYLLPASFALAAMSCAPRGDNAAEQLRSALNDFKTFTYIVPPALQAVYEGELIKCNKEPVCVSDTKTSWLPIWDGLALLDAVCSRAPELCVEGAPIQ